MQQKCETSGEINKRLEEIRSAIKRNLRLKEGALKCKESSTQKAVEQAKNLIKEVNAEVDELRNEYNTLAAQVSTIDSNKNIKTVSTNDNDVVNSNENLISECDQRILHYEKQLQHELKIKTATTKMMEATHNNEGDSSANNALLLLYQDSFVKIEYLRMLILQETQLKTHNQNSTEKSFNMISSLKSIDTDGFSLPRLMDHTINRIISRKETASKMLEAALAIQNFEKEPKSSYSLKGTIRNMISSTPSSPNQDKSTEFMDHLHQLIVIYHRALKKYTQTPNIEINEDLKLLESYIKKATMSGTIHFTLFGVSGLDEDMIKDSKAVSKDRAPQRTRSHPPLLESGSISPLIELTINIDGHKIFKSNDAYASKTCFNSISNDWPILKNKEVEFIVKSSDSNVMVAHGSLTLLEFLDGQQHKIRIPLEPLGFVYCSVKYNVPRPRKAKINRQKRIFIKGKPCRLVTDFNQNFESWKNILKLYDNESVKDEESKIISPDDFDIQPHGIKADAELSILPKLVVKWEVPSEIDDKISHIKISSVDTNDFKKASCILSGVFENQFNQNHHSQQKITICSFKLINVLGFGYYGKVLLGELLTDKRKCAIKAIPKLTIVESDDFEMLTIEKRILILATEFKHPFLVHLFASFTTNDHACYAMEYMPAGDLMTNIRLQLFSEPRTTFYGACVLLGIEFLHSHGVMYRDLKLDNLLLDSHGYVKIGDFGLSKSGMWHGVKTTTFCGTPEFISPEMLCKSEYTRTSDWWAFGVLIFQMSTGESPFNGEETDDMFNSIIYDDLNVPHYVAKETRKIISKLLDRNPNTRLGSTADGAADIKKHPYFNNINFVDLLNKKIIPEYIPQFDNGEYSYIQDDVAGEKPVLTAPPKPLPTLTPDQDRFFENFLYSSV